MRKLILLLPVVGLLWLSLAMGWNMSNVAVLGAAKPKAIGGGGGGVTPTYRWQADSGVNQSAGTVLSWTDNVAGLVLTTTSNPNIDTGVQNGLPGIWFNTGNYLANKLPSPLTSGTVIAVVKTTTAGAGNYAFVMDGTNATDRWYIYKGNTDKLNMGAGGTELGTAAAIANGSLLIIAATFNGSSSSISTNGVSVATGDIGAHNLTGITIGSDYSKALRWFSDAYLFELSVYPPLNGTDTATAVSTANTKWAIY